MAARSRRARSPSQRGPAAFVQKIVNGEFNGQAMVGSNVVSVSAKKKVANAPTLSEHAQSQIKGYQKYKSTEEGAGDMAGYDATMVDYIPPEWGAKKYGEADGRVRLD